MIQWHRENFDELTKDNLYRLLQLRQKIFALEQNSVYLDIDGKDKSAMHLFVTDAVDVIACCRLLAPSVKYAEPAIGRVCIAQSHRGKGLGKELMLKTIALSNELYPAQGIRISAQLYLKNFYSDLGFDKVSAPYDEDGIPHIEMLCLAIAQHSSPKPL